MSEERRLYLAEPGWHPVIKQGAETLHCHLANAADGYYHRIAAGEVYVSRDTDHYCLNCALKKGILTSERPTLPNPQLR